MVIKHKVPLIAALTCFLGCIAAAAVFFAVRAAHPGASDAVYSSGCCFSAPDGFLFREDAGAFRAFDFKTLKSGFLWSSAAASSFAKAPTALLEYGGSIYAAAAYGANKSFLYEADRAGKRKDTLAELDSDAGGRLLAMDGRLYFESTVHKVKDLAATDEGSVSIGAVDLKTRQVTRVTPLHTGTDACIMLAGAYGDDLYYLYSSKSEVQNGKTVNNRHSVFQYNLKTGKETEILKQAGSTTGYAFYQGSVYYMLINPTSRVTTLYRHHLDTGADDVLASDQNLMPGIQCFDGKIFYRKGVAAQQEGEDGLSAAPAASSGGKSGTAKTQESGEDAQGLLPCGYFYDLASQTTRTAPVIYDTDVSFTIIGESPDLFIISHQSVAENGQVKEQGFAWLKKADYYKGIIKPTDFE